MTDTWTEDEAFAAYHDGDLHPHEGATPAQETLLLGAADSTVGMPPMIGRAVSVAEWLEYVASYHFGSMPPTRVVLHHTYIPDETTWRGLASMRGMQGYYAKLGWSSAPHLYTHKDRIWLFTPMYNVGIHAGVGNGSVRDGWYSLGLETVGFFDTRRPDPETWASTCAVMGALSLRLGIAPRDLISFHRDYTDQKSCPGNAITKEWVWSEVEHWIARQQRQHAATVDTLGVYTTKRAATISQDRSTLAPVALHVPAGTALDIQQIQAGSDGERWGWISNGTGFIPMRAFADVQAFPDEQPIIGGPTVPVDALLRWLVAHRSDMDASERHEIATAYTAHGAQTGIGNLLPFMQAVKETDLFRSARFVQARNPAGIGATNDGAWGMRCATVDEGVQRQFGHLCCYALGADAGTARQQQYQGYSPRKAIVAQVYGLGCAPRWIDLTERWAKRNAGEADLSIYDPRAYGMNIVNRARQCLDWLDKDM